MKISGNWLKDYIKTDLKTEKIAEYLTDIGLEVEGVETFETIRGSLAGIKVGKVLTCEQHPNADRLKKTTVDVGSEILQIVCGAPNVEAGQTVPVATVGTELYTAEGKSFTITEAKIRGEKSQGMICSQSELGMGEDQSGIWVLKEDKFEAGKNFSEYFNLYKDEVFEIGLTPNRTDAMSHYGVARDLNAFLVTNKIPATFEKISAPKSAGVGEADFKVQIEDSALCPRYLGAVMKNVKVAESPAWLQDRLRAIGLSPINNIVDISNYILHGTGQPLHIFDAAKIADRTIKVGVAPAGTAFTTLDDTERKLSGEEIMIKDGQNQPLCLAGVFGGKNSGVSAATTEIFIESAYFNPVAIRKAAKQHGLNTDASFRFERGADPAMTKTALQLAVKMITEIAGGAQQGDILENVPEEIKNHYVILPFSKLQQIAGTKLHIEKVKEILTALEIQILTEIQNGLELIVPAYRADVTREIDVIEEILRIYGYNKIEAPQKISFTPVKLNLDDQEALENYWARLLQGQGFNEVMNNSLTHLKDEENAVKLLNPLSSDLAFMRKSLLEGLLENADYNIKRKNADLKFFELGKIYHKNNAVEKGADVRKRYQERKQLALLVTGRDVPENWLQPKSQTDFFKLKSYVLLLLEKLGRPVEELPHVDSRFSEALEILCGGRTVARLGKVASNLLKAADLNQNCFYAEIETEICQEIRNQNDLTFKDIPKFNVLRRDLALLVNSATSYAELHSAASRFPSPYLKKISLFDVYEGDKLPAGKKSYALSFELLNEEKTLEEKDITEVMNGLIKLFQKDFGAELRS